MHADQVLEEKGLLKIDEDKSSLVINALPKRRYQKKNKFVMGAVKPYFGVRKKKGFWVAKSSRSKFLRLTDLHQR